MYVMVEDENNPKLTKTEEKESFLKRLEERNKEAEKVRDEIKALVERQEELASRKILGGISDAGTQPEPVKEMTAAEYAKAVDSGKLNQIAKD